MIHSLNIYNNESYNIYPIKKYMIPTLFNTIISSLETNTKFHFTHVNNYKDKRILIAEYFYYIIKSCKYIRFNIYESDIVKKQINSHKFDKYKGIYNNIKIRLSLGKGIEPYLSNRATNFNYSDKMYDDWKILHLHLGKIKNGKAIRTNFTLRLIISNNNAYFIKLSPHNNRKILKNTYANVNDLQIFNDNWPGTIFKINDIAKKNKIYQTSNEIMKYRKYGIKHPNILYDKNRKTNFGGMILSFGIADYLPIVDSISNKLLILIKYIIDKNIVDSALFKKGYFKLINNEFISFYSTVNKQDSLVFFIPYIQFLFYMINSLFPQSIFILKNNDETKL